MHPHTCRGTLHLCHARCRRRHARRLDSLPPRRPANHHAPRRTRMNLDPTPTTTWPPAWPPAPDISFTDHLNRLRVSLLVQGRLRRDALRAALARRPRAPHPWSRHPRSDPPTRSRMICTTASGIKGASRRDAMASGHPGPRTRRAAGLAMGRRSLLAIRSAHPARTPEGARGGQRHTGMHAAGARHTRRSCLRNEKVRGSNPLSSTHRSPSEPPPGGFVVSRLRRGSACRPDERRGYLGGQLASMCPRSGWPTGWPLLDVWRVGRTDRGRSGFVCLPPAGA